MNYRFKIFNGFFSSLVEHRKQTVQIIVNGQILDYRGKSVWNSTGPARNALRRILTGKIRAVDCVLKIDPIKNRYGDSTLIREEVDEIMKTMVGIDPSFPFFLKIKKTRKTR